ncbi:5-methyltetrahydropteroyltriglutamate--homocysteine S-methyltransferase [Alteromonadaceae bacterium BrNp21-10]|nr:5-methyltetrahydropteroyltriglutamate--homocysteine S-methyltransferase [Alteromonadaceae bacterium BrNp21-10]
MRIHNLGFPRIGLNRELKFSLEQYWRADISAEELSQSCKILRAEHWQLQQQAGIELLPVGDFAHYDHVLNTSLYLGIVPARFQQHSLTNLDVEFNMARGQAPGSCGCAASDMTKWFDTNYHYIVPEFAEQLDIKVNISNLIEQIQEARAIQKDIKPVLLGPLSYLWLGTATGTNDDRLRLLPSLLEGYQQIFDELNQHNVNWLQLDEPILGLELNNAWLDAFKQAYQTLKKGNLKLLLTSYFASIEQQLALVATLPFNGVHLDILSETCNVDYAINTLPKHWVISLGVINGRNIWRTDLTALYQQLEPIYEKLAARLWLAPSCSLLHTPVDLDQEQQLDNELKSWLAFAKQKCQELALLKKALTTGELAEINAYSLPVKQRAHSLRINDQQVQSRQQQLQDEHRQRSLPFTQRKSLQASHLKLPLFPTTTIGSFPQTQSIRSIRSQWKRQELSDADYNQAIKKHIKDNIDKQLAIDLDVLVHGEPERNDMVEYFGELLSGIAVTQQAWVQSYGSRCVKPPIIFGDVSRPDVMTLDWIQYAQSLTSKPVKGMLTGPVTILCWSFVRDDLPLPLVAEQVALAISDEIDDLVANNINIIQVDEPAIREGMPLKQSQWQHYLEWATRAFRLSCATAPAQVQIHSHMCYSEFNDILQAIIDLDADVLTIETSRSNMAVLNAFDDIQYPNDLGPGVYDIHSPNIPNQQWIIDLLNKARQHIDDDRLWVNPDCGLKTRGWEETTIALDNMVKAAKTLRAAV